MGPVILSPRAQLDPTPVSGQQENCMVSSLSLYGRVFGPGSGSMPLLRPHSKENYREVSQSTHWTPWELRVL